MITFSPSSRVARKQPARSSSAPEPITDERREHLEVERAFVMRGLKELLKNTEGMC